MRNFYRLSYISPIPGIGRYLIILPSSIQLKLNTFLLQFGRTEVIDNTLNPDFVRKFIMDYFFEERENLRFDL